MMKRRTEQLIAEVMKLIAEMIAENHTEYLSLIKRLLSVVEQHAQEIEALRTETGRALLEVREAKAEIAQSHENKAKIKLLEQELQEVKADVERLQKYLLSQRDNQ